MSLYTAELAKTFASISFASLYLLLYHYAYAKKAARLSPWHIQKCVRQEDVSGKRIGNHNWKLRYVLYCDWPIRLPLTSSCLMDRLQWE